MSDPVYDCIPFFKEVKYEVYYIKEETKVEENYDSNVVIKQEPEGDQCSDTFEAQCSSTEDHGPCTEACGKNVKKELFSLNDEISIKCEPHDETFQSEGNLNSNTTNVHPSVKPFQCELCLKTFSKHKLLKLHILTHSNERPFKCDICDKRFKTKNPLNDHMKIVHATVKSFQCQMCPKSYSLARFLKRHVLSHSKESCLKCDQCPKTYQTQCGLANHKAQRHSSGSRFSCDVCGKQFRHLLFLKLHKVKHSDEFNFHCEICFKKFKSKSNLLVHINYFHSTERPFQCDECPKSFSKARFLKRHVLHHSQEKPFMCHLCSKNYKFKFDLCRHIKNAHKVEDPDKGDDVKVEPTMVNDSESVLDLNLEVKEEIEDEILFVDVGVKQEPEEVFI